MAILGASDTLDDLGPGDRTLFWRAENHDGLECLEARFRTHVFPPHSHETYVLGTVLRGQHHYQLAGQQICAGPGQMCFHAVVDDTLACQLFLQTHRALEAGVSSLAADEQLLMLFFTLLKRYGDGSFQLGQARREPLMLSQVKDYLLSHIDERVDLKRLASISGLSPFYLIRCFRKETGLTPFHWLMDKRIHKARHLLRQGRPVIEVAMACGFYDQSHFSRSFKSRLGVTPGQFRQMEQNGA